MNGELVRSVTLSPGAYGADYGRSLGGIVRVETANLPASGVHGAVRADTLDGAALATVAASNDFAWRWLVATGGSPGCSRPSMRPTSRSSIPQYRDCQAKAEWAMRDGESLDLLLLGSGDNLTRTIPDANPAHARSQSTHTAFERVFLATAVR